MTDLVREYATALFSLTEEEGATEEVLSDTTVILSSLAAAPDYLRILFSPHIDNDEKHAVLTRTFRKAHPHLLHFLMLLTDRGYAREIPACLEAYEVLYRDANGIKRAIAESAVPLTNEERERLTKTLSRRFACTVELVEKVDPALLGGVRVTIDGKCFDSTARHHLDGIRDRLSSTVL